VTASASTETVSIRDCGASYVPSPTVGAPAATAASPDATSVAAAPESTPVVTSVAAVVTHSVTVDLPAPASVESPTSVTATSTCTVTNADNPTAGVSEPGPSVPVTSTSPTSPADTCYEFGPNFQFPHLIEQLDATTPDAAPGTGYFVRVSRGVNTIINFDIPTSYANMTCNLIWTKPANVESVFPVSEFNVPGNIIMSQLVRSATLETTWNTRPARVRSDVISADGTTVSALSGPCAAGTTVSYELEDAPSSENYFLQFFQYFGSGCPVGLFIDAH